MPDRAGAPRLRRDPGDDLEQVLLLLRVVLVLEHAVRLAAAAQVQAHARVPARRPVRVDEHVARGHAVAEPVRHRLEDAGHGDWTPRPPAARRAPRAASRRASGSRRSRAAGPLEELRRARPSRPPPRLREGPESTGRRRRGGARRDAAAARNARREGTASSVWNTQSPAARRRVDGPDEMQRCSTCPAFCAVRGRTRAPAAPRRRRWCRARRSSAVRRVSCRSGRSPWSGAFPLVKLDDYCMSHPGNRVKLM